MPREGSAHRLGAMRRRVRSRSSGRRGPTRRFSQAWDVAGVDESELLMASRSLERGREVRVESPPALGRTTLLARRARPDAEVRR
jgi:hypothetical protein